MDPAFIALFGTLAIFGLGELFVWLKKPKPKAIDWHWVREQEMEVWGEYFSELKCGPGCKQCKAKTPIVNTAVRSPQLATPPASPKCHVCDSVSVRKNGDSCRPCALDLLRRRRELREEVKKNNAASHAITSVMTPNERRRFNIPDDVPDYAHITKDYDPQQMTDRLLFKWTDESTGKTMGRVVLVPDLERMIVNDFNYQ